MHEYSAHYTQTPKQDEDSKGCEARKLLQQKLTKRIKINKNLNHITKLTRLFNAVKSKSNVAITTNFLTTIIIRTLSYHACLLGYMLRIQNALQKKTRAQKNRSDFVDFLPDNHRVFFSDFSLGIRFIIELTSVLVGITMQTAVCVSATAVETSETKAFPTCCASVFLGF